MLEMALGQMHGLIVDNSGMTKTNENNKVGITHEHWMGEKCF